ncbi:hypothetical protein QYE76_010825 [Lolium multiflorum]|uniref:Uncharacterized protein n=1 Tax=Lolium multiflorum TaxID=4521 RepID=A0AAD8X294_LOLMU|nr:hypothetical protein QYE76_010825 [Lolium multiflorum]
MSCHVATLLAGGFNSVFYSSSVRVVSGATVAYFVTPVGQSAPPEMLQMLTYLAMKHDANMQCVDTVRAYSFGALYFVEALQEDGKNKKSGKRCQLYLNTQGVKHSSSWSPVYAFSFWWHLRPNSTSIHIPIGLATTMPNIEMRCNYF